jgi:hypothetical protein
MQRQAHKFTKLRLNRFYTTGSGFVCGTKKNRERWEQLGRYQNALTNFFFVFDTLKANLISAKLAQFKNG